MLISTFLLIRSASGPKEFVGTRKLSEVEHRGTEELLRVLHALFLGVEVNFSLVRHESRALQALQKLLNQFPEYEVRKQNFSYDRGKNKILILINQRPVNDLQNSII